MYTYKAKVTRVVDGDTVDCDVDLGFEVHAHTRLRLAGIDAPEVRGKEKVAGKAASAALHHMMLFEENLLDENGDEVVQTTPDPIIIETGKKGSKGKYGRWVAWLWLEADYDAREDTYERRQMSINAKMVKDGHAVWSDR